MAPRIKIRHDENTKAKIKASQLVNFLQNHALTDGSEASQSRIDAAKFLLNKVLSNPPTDVNNNLSGNVTCTWQK